MGEIERSRASGTNKDQGKTIRRSKDVVFYPFVWEAGVAVRRLRNRKMYCSRHNRLALPRVLYLAEFEQCLVIFLPLESKES